MSFLVSPGVHVKEIDLTNVVPAVATTVGAIALPASRGPVGSIVTITSEEELVKTFGKPNANNFENWFCAANFLQYSDQLKVIRPVSGLVNAAKDVDSSGDPSDATPALIRDDDHYQSTTWAGVGDWAARDAGAGGNAITVSVCANAAAYETTYSGASGTVGVLDGTPSAGDTTITIDIGGGSAGDGGKKYKVGDIIYLQETSGQEYEVTEISNDTLTIRRLDDANGRGLASALSDATNIRRRWRFYDLFDAAPGTSQWATDNGKGENDEMHIVIYDSDSYYTGFDNDVAGQRINSVMEIWSNVSKHPNAKTAQGNNNYYPDVIFRGSQYVFWTAHPAITSNNWGTDLSAGTSFSAVDLPLPYALTGGTSDYDVTHGEYKLAYDLFADTESLDINLVLGGAGTPQSASITSNAAEMDTHGTMITDLCELRKDCVGFLSPYKAATVGVTDSIDQTSNVTTAFDLLPSSSYIVFDSGYKYMYDKYNDVYRYIPLNGDTAGLCANADKVADPWWSPAGLNRGHVRGAIKLSYNPKQAERDQLYRKRINPVTNFPGQGVVLFGDKTALAKPSAFDRINVRRLFLVLEKAIATAAKYQLFEFNDEFTRAQFRNMVEPFLRDVQGRRGIFDFKVVCDGTNNTGEVIDRNEFIGDIYIKPARSINFITLNFIATRTGVAFSEVGG